MKYSSALLITVFLFGKQLPAQVVDSIQIEVGSVVTAATKNHQPLWIVANRWGSITDRQLDGVSFLSVHNKFFLGKEQLQDIDSFSIKERFYVSYGSTLLVNNHFKKSFLNEGYLKLGFKNWEVRGGRYKEIVGEADKDLSTGSLGVSANAVPIPKISAAVTNYTPVPFTKGWLSFKGEFSHGWMGPNQHMKDAFLHQKTFYGRLGKGKLKLFGGVQHYAVWGGRRSDWLSLDRNWKGYMDVVLVREADDGSYRNGTVRNGTDTTTTRPILPNRSGDHRGVVEGGIDWERPKVTWHIYHQTPFEMGQGITFKNIDKLLGIGLTFINKKSGLIKLLGEFIYTKQMNNFYAPAYRESYYNNGVYKTGWEYENRIIGTPLFVNRIRANKYFPAIKPIDWNMHTSSIQGNTNIVNNRVVGGHLGALVQLGKRISYRSIFTLTRNYGTYSEKNLFLPHKDQLYTLQEAILQTPSGLKFTAAFALDWGQLTTNSGLMFGISKRFSINL